FMQEARLLDAYVTISAIKHTLRSTYIDDVIVVAIEEHSCIVQQLLVVFFTSFVRVNVRNQEARFVVEVCNLLTFYISIRVKCYSLFVYDASCYKARLRSSC